MSSTDTVTTDLSPRPALPRGRRLGAVLVTAGAFAGLAGLAAPTATAQGYPVGGAIEAEYHAAAEANHEHPLAYFGPATTPELLAGQDGRWQEFAHGNQAIYWHPGISGGEAKQVGGDIRSKWGQTATPEGDAWENGPLGYPTTREWSTRPSSVTGETGRGNHFQGGTVYSVPGAGTSITWGFIREAWWQIGAEDSRLGLPVGDERVTDTGWIQDFEGGTIETTRDGRVSVNVNEDGAPPVEDGEPGGDVEEVVGGMLGDLLMNMS